MLERILLLFRKNEVVAELQKGAMAPSRARDFLVTALFLSMSGNLISSAAQLFKKTEGESMPALWFAFFFMALVVVGLFFLFRYLLENLYQANGGDNGRLFYERLFLLMLSAGLRVGVVMIGLVFLLLLPVLMFPGMGLLALLFAALIILAGIAGLVWMYLEIKEGFRRVAGA